MARHPSPRASGPAPKPKAPAAKRKAKERGAAPAAAAGKPLRPPPGGAVVRMYRVGHGDCFLIAFAGEDPRKPAHVLIDCGYKPGSPEKLRQPTEVKAIGRHVIDSTGGFVDVAVVTHEHQDHVNGLTPANFPGLKVGKVWFAWTENPKDDVADQLRKKFKDRLLGLLDARANLANLGMDEAESDLARYLQLELGDQDVADFDGAAHLGAAGKDPAKSANKVAMKFLRDCAPGEPDYLYPHEDPRPVPGAAAARAFVLGPPRDVDRIDDLDPVGDENYGEGDEHGFGAAAAPGGGAVKGSPFPHRHAVPLAEAFGHAEFGAFFETHYGRDADADQAPEDGKAVADNASWRRMTKDDAADAGALALAMNNATNNASLVLAFELSKGGKVLLFVGDAQAGNWRSWSDRAFGDGVTARDLLGRTVLYKVGHHGSHNATLNGTAGSDHACLPWMAQGRHAAEFTAMITAVEAWAHQKPKPDWNHPLPAIKKALVDKAGGRVLQTDSALPPNPAGDGAGGWRTFVDRVTQDALYFDLRIDP